MEGGFGGGENDSPDFINLTLRLDLGGDGTSREERSGPSSREEEGSWGGRVTKGRRGMK